MERLSANEISQSIKTQEDRRNFMRELSIIYIFYYIHYVLY